MKKLFSFFIILSFVDLFAQEHKYSIKLDAYKYRANAIKAVENTKFNTYILIGEKYYSHCTGDFISKKQALINLKKAQKKFKNAYIIKINSKILTPKPIVKKQIIKSNKKDYYKIGKSLYTAGNYDSAFAVFDQLLINEPNNHLARLEYARTLYKLGFYKKAKKEFKIVLKTNPPKNVQNNIYDYIKAIDSKRKKHYFYGSIGIGLTYDDNLRYITDKPTTMYGTLELQNDTNKTKGFYEIINLSLYHRYIGKHFNWSNQLYSYNEFQNEDIANLNFLSYITSLSKKIGRFKVSIPLGVSNVWLDSNTYNSTYLINPTISFHMDKTTNLSIASKHQNTNVSHNKNRDYTTNGTNISFLKTFDALTLYANGAFEKDRRIEKNRFDISKDKAIVITNIYYQLLKNSQIGIGYRHDLDRYIEIDPVLGYKREDKKSNYSANIKQELGKNESATISFQKTNNHSNINTYNYKKSSYNLSYKHKF